jgi:hypothetical protein
MRVILPVALCFMWMGLAWAQAPQSGRAAGCEHSPDYERSCGYEHSGNSINLQDHL